MAGYGIDQDQVRAYVGAGEDDAGAQLCAIARPLSDDSEAAEDMLTRPLISAGLSRQLALSYYSSVVSLVLGWCIYEQSEALHDYLARMIGFDESFTIGLNAMVAGFP